MPNTGTTTNGNALSTLAERIRARTEQERQEIEALTRQQFNALQQSLHESSKHALDTTEAAIQSRLTALEKDVARRCGMLTWMFGKRFLQALLLSFALCLGLILGGWGLMRWKTNQIVTLNQESAQLKTYIAALEKTVEQLEAKTWGLELTESKDGRFIILPPKATLKTGWTFGTRQAAKLE